jgi:hypothetical protein
MIIVFRRLKYIMSGMRLLGERAGTRRRERVGIGGGE